MAGMLTPGYVHHTPWGDWNFTQFRAGMDYVDSVFSQRQYRSSMSSTMASWWRHPWRVRLPGELTSRRWRAVARTTAGSTAA